MARRRNRKIPTAERTLVFDLNPDNEQNIALGNVYLDLAQCYSLVNRVFMRQGNQFAIQSLQIGCQSGGAFEATISRLPEHWPAVNAWVKTMALWRKQQDDTAEEAGIESTRGRYRDFKIHFDANHSESGFGTNLLPSTYFITDPASATEYYDWGRSQIVVPNQAVVGNTVEYFLHMLGPDAALAGDDTVGMIEAYAESRARPFAIDPNYVDAPFGGIFGEMFDVGDDSGDIITNYQEANNQPPYLIGDDDAQEYYPGGSFQGKGFGFTNEMSGTMVDVMSVNAGTTLNSKTIGGFTAPCGLLKFRLSATGVNTPGVPNAGDLPFGFWMKIVLAPGPMKGIMARPMQEVN